MGSTLQKMRSRYFRPLLRQFHDFWCWWTDELVAILPRNLQAAILFRDRRICIDTEESDLIVRTGATGEMKEIGRVCLNPSDSTQPELPIQVAHVLLLLPADKILVKRLTLPLAAEENLREALSFEMDRQTPFSVEQVYYDSVIVKRDAASQALAIDLVLAPRSAIDDLLERLADAGLHPDVISARVPNAAQPLAVNLLPAARRKRKTNMVRRRNIALVAVNLLLLAAVISVPLLQKQQLINSLQAQVEEVTIEATKGSELRQQVQQLVDASTYLKRKKQTEPLVIRVFDEITRVLPDNTWINRLIIGAQEIQLQGQSSSAAALIPLLEKSALLQDVQFRSPVVRTPTTGEERFHVSAILTRDGTP